jgi:hypothetical protein
MAQVKISERILPIEDAARRLRGLELRVSATEEALGFPFDVNFPHAAGAASQDRSMILEIRGGYCDLMELQRMVN